MHNFPISILRATEQVKRHASKEINAWMRAQLVKQVDPNQMVAAMVQAGHPQETAAMLVALARQEVFLGEHQDDRIRQRVGPQLGDVPHAEEHFLDLGDRVVRRTMSLGSLEVALYEDFLSEEEIAHIIKTAEPTLERSKVVGPNMSNLETPIRTSDGTFLSVGQDAIVTAIEARIERLTKIPAAHGEGLQVLRYRGAQEYKPHFDFFEPQSPDEARQIDLAGNRVGTLILYLNDVEKGGGTYFPQLNLAIHPKKGSALWFAYLGADGVPDMRSEHAGLPVLAGEKWIATKWLRQRAIPAHAQPRSPSASAAVVPFPGRQANS